MIINNKWAMPNKNTFSINPIKNLIDKVICDNEPKVIVDPFANSSTYGTITNDLNEIYDTTYHMDALEFLKNIPTNSVDMVLYDPPYSPRQIKEVYDNIGNRPDGNYTKSSFWSKQKDEISRITKSGGIVISFGWNSNGIGKSRGFTKEEILLVSHGGNHNDTIVTVDRKSV